MKTIKEFVCNPLPTPNCHATTVLPLPDGSVITAWFGGTKEGTTDVDIWYSRRDENGWSEPKSVCYKKHIPHWNPVLFLRENGEIMLFFKVGKQIHSWRTFVSISTDGGKTFGKPYELSAATEAAAEAPLKTSVSAFRTAEFLLPHQASSEAGTALLTPRLMTA